MKKVRRDVNRVVDLAMRIETKEQLDYIISQAEPGMQEGVRAMLEPVVFERWLQSAVSKDRH